MIRVDTAEKAKAAIAPILFATFEGRKKPVASVEDAARKWIELRNASGAGVSSVGNGVEIVDGAGAVVARVSYNGRIWNPDGTEKATQIVRAWNEPEEAMLAIVAASVAQVVTEPQADPQLATWERYAAADNLVCVVRAGRVHIAFQGKEEPRDFREWLRMIRRSGSGDGLGSGGRGFLLVDVFGEATITHNLWSLQEVPARYAHLFKATHLRVDALTREQDDEHWTSFDPFVEDRRAA